ncbi:hypothetical protein H101_08126 [Trichophyton interdigitale H6]|nr:hypothetical protein H101_08126 [Trichophyton interdigitale H6]
MPIEQYCSRTVDTVRTEIDEIGLQALVDGVIEASGFDVQILYLDRSQGDQVNAHQLTPQRTDSLGVIKLLYRPPVADSRKLPVLHDLRLLSLVS